MGKRYYCDYCDRSFQDNMHNRKKHLYGVQHHRSKKAWFDHFRDTAATLYDEQTKKPCRKFLQTGQCVFGNNCRFSHMSETDMENLRMQIEDERRSREDPEHRVSPERSIEEWLTKMEKKRAALKSGSVLKDEDEEDEANQPENDIPPHFLTIPDLPPSLLPPPHGGWKIKARIEWG
ncbi:zinc finger matrin-type protein 5 [Esox lucius]|uniref:Zinc finger matrin-type protein 5 n=1 Tax=Esox lucius TaxID=8010 RepID=C1BX99_ESOLU|nr:zinc finger matrin-type protein 5 [Esox lucius]ACO13652.1 Zinc finger matrin-type protein 5 [Esox lucius]